MKKLIFAITSSCLFFSSCATKPPFADADKTAKVWDEIYECIRTAPPGKSCGSQFKAHTYKAKISLIQKDKSGQTQIVSRFGSGDKAFTCALNSDNTDLMTGDLIEFEGTVSGINAKPLQRSVELDNCSIRKF